MTEVLLSPAPARGSVRAPPSKSYTHRALVAACLTGRPYHLHRPNDSDDTRATREALRLFGCRFEFRTNGWTVHPEDLRRSAARPPVADCHSSGTTLRLLTAMAARLSRRTGFRGSAGLAARPIAGLLDALVQGGARFRGPPAPLALPFSVRGPLRPGRYSVEGGVSSQYVSALLCVLPTLGGSSELTVRGPLVSAGYVEATRALLAYHEVRVGRTGPTFAVPGPQPFIGRQFFVPGDASSASYLWAAAAITGGRVTVRGLDRRWPQPDLRVLPILRSMGARVTERAREATVAGPLENGFDEELTDSPDLYPLLGVLAASLPGERSLLRGAPQVEFKESRRRRATAALAHALGARVRLRPDGLEISGGRRPASLQMRRISDHRVVMSAAVGALALRSPSRIGRSTAVEKSFPRFWEVLGRLGPGVESGG